MTDLYRCALTTGALDMPTTQAPYGGSLVRVDLLGGFERAGAQMVVAAASTTERTRVDFAGQNRPRRDV